MVRIGPLACLFVACFLSMPVLASSASAAVLEITVRGVRNADGLIRLAVCDNRVCYSENDGFVAKQAVAAASPEVTVRFADLPEGEYSVMMYHDENGNNSFDKSWIGFPEEGFGFSRDAKPGFSKPGYDKVRLELDGPELKTSITVQYW